MISFYHWLMRRYLLRMDADGAPVFKNNRYGDLAYDVQRDRDFPRTSSSTPEIMSYLAWCRACDGAMETARSALKMYRVHVRDCTKEERPPLEPADVHKEPQESVAASPKAIIPSGGSSRNHIRIKPCPHCGGAAELKRSMSYKIPTYRVQCTRCGASSALICEGMHSGYGVRPDVFRTAEDAQREAVERWNRAPEASISFAQI